MALATLGFFFAPISEKPLRVGLWLLGVAVVAYGAQTAGSGQGGFALWFASSIAGALLVLRGGSRAARYCLPEAGGEAGEFQQREIRAQLQLSVALFLVGYLFDRWIGTLSVALSGVFFFRYVLLQTKYLGVTSAPLRVAPGIVPSQRWVVLLSFAIVGGTELPQALLGERGQGSLLVTGALLSLTAALAFVLTIARAGWPRPFVRRASFFAGMALAVAVTAVLVELESWDRTRYRVFASAGIAFLVVLPFLRSQTKLFDSRPRFAALAPPAMLSVMMAPVTAVNGTRGSFSTTVFLFSFAVLMLIYYFVMARRERSEGKIYLAASLAVSLFAFFTGGGSRTWQVFMLSVGLVLYAIDLFERVWRESRHRARIPAR
ncbi:MAG: hypothetical protein ACRD21_00440 [Vicinamibacteria bacterium]